MRFESSMPARHQRIPVIISSSRAHAEHMSVPPHFTTARLQVTFDLHSVSALLPEQCNSGGVEAEVVRKGSGWPRGSDLVHARNAGLVAMDLARFVLGQNGASFTGQLVC
jgi:hypothetical protein